MLFSILGFITGLAGPLSNLANKIVDLKSQRLKAETDIERHKIDQQIEEVHDKRAVLIAEAGSRIGVAINASCRLILAIPAGVILYKLLVWDKVIGSFDGCAGKAGNALRCVTYNTDVLDTNQWAVIAAVIGFYFLTTWRK